MSSLTDRMKKAKEITQQKVLRMAKEANTVAGNQLGKAATFLGEQGNAAITAKDNLLLTQLRRLDVAFNPKTQEDTKSGGKRRRTKKNTKRKKTKKAKRKKTKKRVKGKRKGTRRKSRGRKNRGRKNRGRKTRGRKRRR